jgi:endonuclease/exonuclease/phosphatase family metal-dependent hydrolase
MNLVNGFTNQIEDTTNTSVLICGDFNIDFEKTAYKKMIEVMGGSDKLINIQHSYFSDSKLFKKTFGANKYDIFARIIDYAFILKETEKKSFLPLEIVDFKVQNDVNCYQVSDHYPLIFSLIPKNF